MISNREVFLKNTAQTSDSPRLLEIDRAEGIYLYGPNGEKYMDLVSGFNVSNIGHRHPQVLKAIQEQLDRFMHVTVYGEFVQAPQVLLDRKSTRLNSSHVKMSYAVFCLKKKH